MRAFVVSVGKDYVMALW